MHTIKEVIQYLEQIAPPAYQEAYDNVGLVVGNTAATTTGILICLDITESVLKEAHERNCNLIIAHHPLIFKPVYHMADQSPVTQCMTYAIKHDLAIYVMHTNLDNVAVGVNQQLSQILGLEKTSILLPRKDTLGKLTTFVPHTAAEIVRQALHSAGARYIAPYTHSLSTTNAGICSPSDKTTPHQLEQPEEECLEIIFPLHLQPTIIAALQHAHPYEEAPYTICALQNTDKQVGSGMIGQLPEPLDGIAFLQHLKTSLNLTCIRHTTLPSKPIQRVAVCGGAGSFLIKHAQQAGADALVTADVKYHDFFQATSKIVVADVGHYESEVGTKQLIYTLLSEKFANIALLKCQTSTNPIHYF